MTASMLARTSTNTGLVPIVLNHRVTGPAADELRTRIAELDGFVDADRAAAADAARLGDADGARYWDRLADAACDRMLEAEDALYALPRD